MADRLPLPDVVTWPGFPFEGDMQVVEVRPYAAAEAPRSGESDKPCMECNNGDDAYVWANEKWRLKTLAPFSPLPISLILETREHIDFPDFEEDLAADLGRIIHRITKAGEAQPEIGRVHTNRWGDGGSHFHIWFLGRPTGSEQLKGLTLPLWGLTLPPLDRVVTQPIEAKIIDVLEQA